MSWRTWFFISLAANILIVGALAGFVLGGGLTRTRAVNATAFAEPRAVAAALPPDVRQALRRDLVRAWFDTNEERAAWREANADVLRQLEAETYDVAAMRAALRSQREASAAAVGAFQDELAQSLADLTPAQRRAAAEALARLRTRSDRGDDPAFEAPAEDPSENADEESPRERLRERALDRLRERRQN